MATFNGQISNGDDDAYEEDTGDTNAAATSEIVDQADEWIGLRFRNVTIPQGSIINSASLSVYITAGTTDEPDIIIRVEDVDDSAVFTSGTGNQDISTRSLNAYTVEVDSSDLGSSGGFVSLTPTNSPANFGALVSIVVNRGGWVSGNALSFIINGAPGVALTRDFGIDFYDLDSARGATLTVDYTAPADADADGTEAAFSDNDSYINSCINRPTVVEAY